MTTYTPAVFAEYQDPNTTTHSSVTVSVSAATNAGDTLLLFIGHNANVSVSSISDTQSNSWSQHVAWVNGTNPSDAVWRVQNAGHALSTSDTITVNYSAACNSAIVGVQLPGNPVFDKYSTATFSSTSGSAASGTLSKPYEIVLGCGAATSLAVSVSWSGSVNTLLATQQAQPAGSGGNTFSSVAYELVSATTSQTATFNLNTGANAAVGIFGYELPGPAMSSASLPDGTTGTSYSTSSAEATTFYAGTATYSITSGSLPPGLSQDTSSGLISGTPTSAGAYTFTAQVSDGNSNTASQSFSITVVAGASSSSSSGSGSGNTFNLAPVTGGGPI